MRKINVSIGVAVLIAYWVLGGILLSQVQAFEVKTSNRSRVRVDVRPLQLSAGKPSLFEIRLNTHSVDLSYDMVKICTLLDDQGKEYRPVSWKGSPAGGHHRSGKLAFPQLEGEPGSVELIMRGVDGVPQRTFQWNLRD